jgi:hypothetical protein
MTSVNPADQEVANEYERKDGIARLFLLEMVEAVYLPGITGFNNYFLACSIRVNFCFIQY